MAPAAGPRELIFIVDPTDGALTVEGLDPSGWAALGGALLPAPGHVNCGRPAAGSAVRLPLAAAGAGADTDSDTGDRTGTSSSSTAPPLRVARIYHGSAVDGPGRRSVVQVQGCPIRCPGCYVPETHDPAGGVALPVDQVVDAVLDPAGAPRDGVTVLGGEPFAQPDALAALLRALKARAVHTAVYSGYRLEALRRRHEPPVHEALALADLLMDGPFVAALSAGAGEWRGSRNQRLIPHPGR
jgi:anaerobic ribonucleoside-triphosphate reductase activating protein